MNKQKSIAMINFENTGGPASSVRQPLPAIHIAINKKIIQQQ